MNFVIGQAASATKTRAASTQWVVVGVRRVTGSWSQTWVGALLPPVASEDVQARPATMAR